MSFLKKTRSMKVQQEYFICEHVHVQFLNVICDVVKLVARFLFNYKNSLSRLSTCSKICQRELEQGYNKHFEVKITNCVKNYTLNIPITSYYI